MEDWEPDESSDIDGRRVYFWVVPANVAGRWTVELSRNGTSKSSASISSRNSRDRGRGLSGSLLAGLREAAPERVPDQFAYVDSRGVRRDFNGRVTGATIEGSFRADNGQEGRWSAAKK